MISLNLHINKVTPCQCCGKERPVRKWDKSYGVIEKWGSWGIADDTKGTLVDALCRCPNCGWVFLDNTDENNLNDSVRNVVFSDGYQSEIKNLSAENPDWVVSWILYAQLCKFTQRYDQAMCAWMKVFDYGVALKKEKWASPLNAILEIYNYCGSNQIQMDGTKIVFMMCLLVDVGRKAENFDMASAFLKDLLSVIDKEDQRSEKIINRLSYLIDTKDSTTPVGYCELLKE